MLLLAVLCLALNLHGIGWGLPNGDRDWEPDSLAPKGPLSFAKRMLYQEPWTSRYPDVHYMVLGGAYAPYVAYLRLTGGLTSPSDSYPYGLADPEFSLMVFTLIARLVSVVMGVGMVIVNYYTVRKLYGPRSALIAALLIATSYPIIHYAHNAEVDVPHLFWASLALSSFVSIIDRPARKHYVLLGIFAALAVGTKDSIYALFVGIGVVLLAVHLRRLRGIGTEPGGRRAAIRNVAWGGCAFVGGLVIAFGLPFNWQGFINHVQYHLHASIQGPKIIRQSSSLLAGEAAVLLDYGTLLFQANVAPVMFLLIAGLVYGLVRFPRHAALALIPMITYYVGFLGLHPSHHIRYALPIYVLLTWSAGKLVDDCLARGRFARVVGGAAIGVILIYAALQGFSVGTLYNRDPRYLAETWLRRNVSPGTTVVAIQPDYTLPRFPPSLHLIRRNVWDYSGSQQEDIRDDDAEFVVLGMSLPRRVQQSEKVLRFLHERGYRLEVEFNKSPVPVFGREIEDISSINPRVAVFRRANRLSEASWSAHREASSTTPP